MHPLTKYYIHQADGGGSSEGVGLIYALPPTFSEDTEWVII